MTRDEVLDVLDKLSPLKRKKIDRAHVPVQFIQGRIAIILPSDSYTADERIRLGGKFQYIMTQTKGQHAFLDFADTWQGLDTPMREGLR